MNKIYKIFLCATAILFAGASVFTGAKFEKVNAENIIAQTHFNIGGSTFYGLDTAESGTLVLPDVITNIETVSADANLQNITGLDLSDCVQLSRIERTSFSTSTNLGGKITFPASLTYLGRDNFGNSKVAEFEFMGDVVSDINFKGNIPTTLTKIIVPYDDYLNASNFTNITGYENLVTYKYKVKVNNIETSVEKEYNTNFTLDEYNTLISGIENCVGITVEGDSTVYNEQNITTLKATNVNLVPVIEEVKQNYTITYSTGDGYVLNGETIVEENNSLQFTLTLDSNYSESEFTVSVLDESSNNVSFTQTNSGNVYTYTINTVNSNLNITVNGVVRNKVNYNVTLPQNSVGFTIAGPSNVLEGTDYSFTFGLDENYDDSAFVINVYNSASDVIFTTNVLSGSYTVNNVTSDITIEVLNVKLNKIKANITFASGNYEFSNSVITPSYTVQYLNNIDEYEFGCKTYVYENKQWKETNEIKNVGKYKYELIFDDSKIEIVNSVTSVEFEIIPKQISVYYEDKEYLFEFNNLKQYPQVKYVTGALSAQEYWQSLGLNPNNVKERLYTVNGTDKTLVYDLPVLSGGESYEQYKGYLTNAGSYYCEVYLADNNFELAENVGQVTGVSYVISPKNFVVSAVCSNVYTESVTQPRKDYSLVVNSDTNEKLNFTLTFSRENGKNVGKYAITGIVGAMVNENLIDNFTFELSTKSESFYTITAKDVYVYWDSNTTFVYDGGYHGPNCWVINDYDGELVLTVSGREKGPNIYTSYYTVTATCNSENFNLINNTCNYVIYPSKISSVSNDSMFTVENNEGFKPGQSAILDNSVIGTEISSSVDKYSKNYTISGGYTLRVVDAENQDVNISNTVNLTVQKPVYFESGMIILQIMEDGSVKEISYTQNGSELKLKDVAVGSSFVFMMPKNDNTAIIIALACSVLVLVGVCVYMFTKHKKSKNKSK